MSDEISRKSFNAAGRPEAAPLRDKDNAAPPHPKPETVIQPAPNLAPPGMSGIRTGLPRDDQPSAPEKTQAGLTLNHPLRTDDTCYTDGRILTMPGYSFMARLSDEPSKTGLDGGRIEQLVLQRDGKVVARYNHGWDMDPKTPEAREAVHRVRNGLDDTPQKEFKGFEPKDKGHGHEH